MFAAAFIAIVLAGACGDTGTTATSGATPSPPPVATEPATTEAATTTEVPDEAAGTTVAVAPTTTVPAPTTVPPTTSSEPEAGDRTLPPALGEIAADDKEFAEATMADVAAVDTGLVAVGTSATGTPTFWTSEDGTSWIRHDGPAAPVPAFAWGVTQGALRLVAVGTDETGDAAVWTSVDGSEWVRAPKQDSLEAAEMHAVTTLDGRLVAVGNARIEQEPWNVKFAVVWTSADGMSWERVPHDDAAFGEDTEMWDVTAAGPGLVAVGGDGQASLVWTSRDGVNWEQVHRETHQEPFLDDTFMYTVAGTQNLVVAAGYDMWGEGATVWTSPDGLSWSLIPDESRTTFERSTVTGVVPHDGGWLAVGTGVWVSADGVSWTRLADQLELWPADFTAVASLDGTASIVGYDWETSSATVWALSD